MYYLLLDMTAGRTAPFQTPPDLLKNMKVHASFWIQPVQEIFLWFLFIYITQMLLSNKMFKCDSSTKYRI